MKKLLLGSLLFLGVVSIHASAFASPTCLDDSGQAMSVDDAQVLQWKVTTANQFLARAHVQGVISAIFPDENGHNHFAIDFDSNPSDNLEVVYNISFGALPTLHVGMTVEACGDYITSDQATAQYPISPAGAIIHWIHRNPKGHGHPSGFLMIDGTLYGQGNGDGS